METMGLRLSCKIPMVGLCVVEHYRNGRLLARRAGKNTFTDGGRQEISTVLSGSGAVPTKISIGTGTTASAVGDDDTYSHALESQVDIQTAVKTLTTIAVTDDACQCVYTFTLAGDNDITEAGLASTTPVLWNRRVFTKIEGKAGDDIKVTWKLQH